MRDKRERQDVVHFHPTGQVIATNETNGGIAQGMDKLDIWPASIDSFRSNSLSQEAKDYRSKHKDKISAISEGVYRLLQRGSPRCATGFAIFPRILATNWHVREKISWPIPRNDPQLTCFPANDVAEGPDVTFLLNGAESSQGVIQLDDSDPVSGLTGHFDIFDFTVLQYNNQEDLPVPNVIFVPSGRVAYPGGDCITISYPGTAIAKSYEFFGIENYPHYVAYLPPFEQLREDFFGFTTKMASFGKITRPYHLEESQWAEHKEYQPDKDSRYVLSNECLLAGSSGGPTLLGDLIIHEIDDIHGNHYLLVEVSSTHFGGEFIPCRDCLSIHPSERIRLKKTPVHQTYGMCSVCTSKGKINPISYNYGISFNHPLIVKFYDEVMRQKFQDLFGRLPPPLEDYFRLHDL